MNKLPPPTPPRIPGVADSEWAEIDAQEVLVYDTAIVTCQVSIDRRNESVALDVVAEVTTASNTALCPQERHANGAFRGGDPEVWNEDENDDG